MSDLKNAPFGERETCAFCGGDIDTLRGVCRACGKPVDETGLGARLHAYTQAPGDAVYYAGAAFLSVCAVPMLIKDLSFGLTVGAPLFVLSAVLIAVGLVLRQRAKRLFVIVAQHGVEAEVHAFPLRTRRVCLKYEEISDMHYFAGGYTTYSRRSDPPYISLKTAAGEVRIAGYSRSDTRDMWNRLCAASRKDLGEEGDDDPELYEPLE